GTWLHEVLQRFHADPRQYEAPQQQEAWLMACAEDARAAHHLSEARFLPFAPLWPHLARTYLAQWQADLAQGVQCHEVEYRLRMPWQDVTLIGTMDRVDRLADGAGWRIVDYKFERKDKTRRRLAEPAEDWQAAVYTALWRHHHPDTPVTMAYLTLSDSGVVQTDQPVAMHVSSATPDECEQSLAHLGDDWQRLRQGAAMPAMGHWDACTHCSARGVCRRDFRASA
ncbi:MAG: PD-(D/E)XK nuclease family protein, partial [Burkholderiaceae bacterium]